MGVMYESRVSHPPTYPPTHPPTYRLQQLIPTASFQPTHPPNPIPSSQHLIQTTSFPPTHFPPNQGFIEEHLPSSLSFPDAPHAPSLYVAITTWLCGSITTYSTWNTGT